MEESTFIIFAIVLLVVSFVLFFGFVYLVIRLLVSKGVTIQMTKFHKKPLQNHVQDVSDTDFSSSDDPWRDDPWRNSDATEEPWGHHTEESAGYDSAHEAESTASDDTGSSDSNS